jgi:hypothetical protein
MEKIPHQMSRDDDDGDDHSCGGDMWAGEKEKKDQPAACAGPSVNGTYLSASDS